jgi:flagellar biosynthesis/type III secretory pathway protein FliH
MGKWDGKMKLLASVAQEDFVSWLVEGARFERELSANFATRDRDGDNLWQISIEGKPCLLNLEFQLKPNENIARRMWEYNVDAAIKYEQPVKSVVVYLREPSHPKAAPPYQLKLPNGEIIHTFSFTVIELCKVETKKLFQTGLKGILPLIPLTQDGRDHHAIEHVIKELRQPGVKKAKELLTLTYGLAALVLKEENEHLWLQRRFAMIDDIINESWAFQEMIQKGHEKGLKEGLKEGLQAQRQSLILLIQKHYPTLLQLAQNVCNAIQTLEESQALFKKVLNAQDEGEVRQILLSAQK